jgi:hypothetical protein
MNIYKSSLFPFIQGDSLVGKPVTLTMKAVKMELVPTKPGEADEKPVLYFKESSKGLILNKTNAKTIAQLYGGETNDWTGKPIELYSERVKAFGQWFNAVRCRGPQNGKPAPAEVVQATGLDEALQVLEAAEPAPAEEMTPVELFKTDDNNG